LKKGADPELVEGPTPFLAHLKVYHTTGSPDFKLQIAPFRSARLLKILSLSKDRRVCLVGARHALPVFFSRSFGGLARSTQNIELTLWVITQRRYCCFPILWQNIYLYMHYGLLP
jgi:hypothetical protein